MTEPPAPPPRPPRPPPPVPYGSAAPHRRRDPRRREPAPGRDEHRAARPPDSRGAASQRRGRGPACSRSRCSASASSRRRAPLLSRQIGIARTIALVLVAITAGLVLRVDRRRRRAVRRHDARRRRRGLRQRAAAGDRAAQLRRPRSGGSAALYTTALVASRSARRRALTVPIAHALGDSWRGGLIDLGAAGAARPARLGSRSSRATATARREALNVRHAKLRDVTRDPLDVAAHDLLRDPVVGLLLDRRVAAQHLREPRRQQHLRRLPARPLRRDGDPGGARSLPRLAARWADQRQLAFWLTRRHRRLGIGLASSSPDRGAGGLGGR